MKKAFITIGCLLTTMVVAVPAPGATKKAEPAVVALTPDGERLQARYTEMLKALQAEIGSALPRNDEQKQADFLKAYQAEAAATAAELKAMRAQGAKGVKDKEAAAKAYDDAKKALALATTGALAPSKAMLADLDAFLASDKWDAQLAKCVVLIQATPRGLAEFAQQGKEQEALVERLLGDGKLMKEMLIAGGANGGNYGRAMQIYTAIQKASPRAGEGHFQRLALGTALEHAVPIAQANPTAQTDAPANVDPVNRYLHYEKACLDGELDPAFKDMSAWEYRLIVDSDAPDQILAWGREMLRNYRPDYIRMANQGWRYSIIVKSDVLYGSQNVKDDLPSLQNYQNIIKNGGVCGRRAFFGRFILRSFGIPTVARPQTGHAALGRWTPDGWVVNLGAGWPWGWTEYGQGPDWVVMTQARSDAKAYVQVQRAQWVGDVLGEKRAFGFNSPASGFWNGVALYRQRAIAAGTQAVELRPLGQDVGESNESKEKDKIEQAQLTDTDRKIVGSDSGAFTIPAVAFSKPTGNTPQLICMRGFSGGTQVHCVRDLKNAQEFEYTLDAPQAGKYAIVARVVTVQSDQKLLLKANDAGEAVDIAVPYTLGKWELTKPVEITLVKGSNVLHFTRPAPSRGVTIKEFTLTPVK